MKALLLASESEDSTIAFASGLAQHLKVVLAVPRRRYGHLASWFDPAVDLRLLEWPRHRLPLNPWFLRGLTRLIRHEQTDLVHLLSNSTLWLNLAVPFWRSIPLVTTVHDVDGLGLVVPSGDGESLSRAILSLAQDNELRCKLGANALIWSHGANSPKQVGAQAADLYRKVMAICM